MIVPFLIGIPTALLFTYWGVNLTDLAYSKIYGKPLIVYDHIYFKKLRTEDIEVKDVSTNVHEEDLIIFSHLE